MDQWKRKKAAMQHVDFNDEMPNPMLTVLMGSPPVSMTSLPPGSISNSLEVETKEILVVPTNPSIFESFSRPRGTLFESMARLTFDPNYPTNGAFITGILLVVTMIGSGVLIQPYVFSQSGILGALGSLLLTTVVSWLGVLCLSATGIHVKILDYSGIAKKAFNERGEMWCDIMVATLTLGSHLVYILVVGTTTSQLLIGWGCQSDACGEFSMMILTVACFVTPICMLRHFGDLAIFSVYCIFAMVTIVLLVIIAGPIRQSEAKDPVSYDLFNLSGTFASIGSILLTFEMCSSNFLAYVALKPEVRSFVWWRRITGYSVIMSMILCSVIGLAGYLSFSNNTQPIILDNFPGTQYDIFRVVIVIHYTLFVPQNFVVMRGSLVKLLTNTTDALMPYNQLVVITAALMVITTGIILGLLALGLTAGATFALLLNITGGVAGALDMFILPGAVYLKLMPMDAPLRIPATCMIVFGVAVLIVVTYECFAQFLS